MPSAGHIFEHPSRVRWSSFAALLLLVSCVPSAFQPVPATKLAFADHIANIYTLSFFADGRLFLETADHQFWYQALPNREWQQLSFHPNNYCIGSFFGQGRILPDGRVGMLCAGKIEHSTPSYTMVAYNWATETLEPLVPGLLPANGMFSWSPSMDRGVFSTVGSSFSTLYWVTTTSIRPIPIRITVDNRAWYLPDSAREQERFWRGQIDYRTPQTVGRAGDVAWSPDGNTVAFWGTLASIGQSSNALQRFHWDVYLLNLESMQVQRIPLAVAHAYGLVWSPDSRQIAYTAPEQGLFVLDLQTEQARRIDTGRFTELAWSPDGTQIIALRCREALCNVPGAASHELWSYTMHAAITASETP